MKNFEVCATFNDGTVTLECTTNNIRLTLQSIYSQNHPILTVGMELTFDDLAELNSLMFLFRSKANQIINQCNSLESEKC